MSRRRQLPFQQDSDDEVENDGTCAQSSTIYEDHVRSTLLHEGSTGRKSESLISSLGTGVPNSSSRSLTQDEESATEVQPSESTAYDTLALDFDPMLPFPDDGDLLHCPRTPDSISYTDHDSSSYSLFVRQDDGPSEEIIITPTLSLSSVTSARTDKIVTGCIATQNTAAATQMLLAPPASYWNSFRDNPYASSISSQPIIPQPRIVGRLRNSYRKSKVTREQRSKAMTDAAMVPPQQSTGVSDPSAVLSPVSPVQAHSTTSQRNLASVAVALVAAYPDSD